jgi:hypothetical protein
MNNNNDASFRNNNTASGQSAITHTQNSDDSEKVHTNSPTSDAPLANVGIIPVSGVLGGNPAGLIGGQSMVAAPTYTAPAAHALIHPLDTDGSNASGIGNHNDGEIAQVVENALAEEPTINMASLAGLRVAVQNGVVELSGSVANDHDRARAEAVAKRMAGVAGVVNRLQLGNRS